MGLGLRKRVAAFLLTHCTGSHERHVAGVKRELLGDLAGHVLEIGPGAGANLPYYPPGIRWTGIEPNPYLHPALRRALAQRGLRGEIRTGRAEGLDLPDASCDAVVGTLVLCSVQDPAAALREIRRVLRPGGRLLFLEHVAAPAGTRLRRLQGWARPLFRLIGDGCAPDRETGATLAAAGFARLECRPFHVPLPVVSPHIAGVAVTAGPNPPLQP